LIKVYEKEYTNLTLEFFFDTLAEMEGFEEYKNIVGNYFVNLLNPTTVSFRPLSFILVGHPGTGKSAIAAKTAEASGKAFIRIPMNGQAEPTYLKGREIAYQGADQGKMLKEILTKGSSKTVVLIDELTRAGSKALIDIVGQMTDPDQNSFIFEDD
jgi:ATP-dependent Lon protease